MRRKLAEARGLPAYMILHDSALRQMARVCPATAEEFASIPGVGTKRASEFGEQFMAVIAEHGRSGQKPPVAG